jgi:hypothetical protein
MYKKVFPNTFPNAAQCNAPYSSERMIVLTDQRLSMDLGELVAADVFA